MYFGLKEKVKLSKITLILGVLPQLNKVKLRQCKRNLQFIMTLQELRKAFDRLSHPETLLDAFEVLNFYNEFYLRATNFQREENPKNHIEDEARLLLQMMLSKTLHLKNIIEGVNFTTTNGITLNNIVDPTIVASIVRNVYETTGMFNLIFRINKLGDERIIAYNLWVISGLKYRQRFANIITQEKNKAKIEKEQKTIDDYIQQIENTELYKRLNEKNKNKIHNQIKQKEYFIHFKGDDVIISNWATLYLTMGAKKEFFENIYTFFSFSTHPSNVAVFQFRDMYLPESKGFIGMTLFNLQYYFMLGAIFIADYITLFPSSINIFNSMPLLNQIIINFNNTFARRDEFLINDSYKALG